MFGRILSLALVCLALGACAHHDCRDGHHGHKSGANATAVKPALVIMTDFGLKDGAVSAMKGVAYATSPDVRVFDLTHEVPAYDIWEGAFRLAQTYKYWPPGTVFVTVVDPGVGSERKSIVAKTKSGHYFVGPDNGLYTLIGDDSGFESVRVLDEAKQRLKGSEDSYTFHGRDLYVYVGARLAGGQLTFDQVGEELKDGALRIPYQKAQSSIGAIKGMIPVLDPQYGNVWTNVPRALVRETFKDAKSLRVTVKQGPRVAFSGELPLAETFAGVAKGKPLLYFNSLLNLSLALNQGNFAARHKISSGPDWTIEITAP
ncbi:MAG: S-adenosyl-l-methionine hydroxide adenosyltransferase family protein [Bdellovibrionota bacterium]